VPLEINSSLWGNSQKVSVSRELAHFAGLAYGDGFPAWGEIRVVTSSSTFADKLVGLVQDLASAYRGTSREYVRPGEISDNPQHNIVLNSTLVRRAFFDDKMQPKYDSLWSVCMDDQLAADAQAGLSDAEGSLLVPVPIESPHGRVFAVINSDRRLLGISRLSLVNKLRLEPSSVRTRLASKKGRRHTTRGIEIVTKKNNYLIEILSGAKRKWLTSVGLALWHPEKLVRARTMLSTYASEKEQYYHS
jgi:hypothetical protein